MEMDKKQKYIDDIFHYTGKWEMPSHCGIMIRRKESVVPVILTELYETNPGSSVTDWIEILAGEIVKKYAIPPETAIFIVRNPERSTHHTFFAETFYRARMNWDGGKFTDLEWVKIKEDDVKWMI
jgi:hypothetical protein